MNAVKVSRTISGASSKPTKVIRVITDSRNHVLAAQKHGVKIGWLICRCEPSKEPPHVRQCLECRKHGHSAIECKNEQRFCPWNDRKISNNQNWWRVLKIKGANAFGEQLKSYVVTQKNQMKLKKVMKTHINKSEQTQTLRKAKYSKCFYMIQWKIIYTKLDLNEHFEKVENETKTFIQCENIEPNNYCIIKVDDYDEIVNKTRRSSPGPDKITYKGYQSNNRFKKSCFSSAKARCKNWLADLQMWTEQRAATC